MQATNPTGKTPRALVTGATAGIGRAAAVKLASDGFEVVVHGRDAARGAEVVREIEAAGGKATFIAAEMSRPEEVRRLAEQAGEVDVLVNNSGFAWFGPTATLDERSSTRCSPPTCALLTSLSPHLRRAWLPAEAAASSTSEASLGKSAFPARRPTAPPKRLSRP